MATGQASNSTSADNLTHLNSHVGFSVGQPKNAMPSYPEPHFQFGQLDLPSHIMPNHHGDMKPFSLPSLASITANLNPVSPEMSLLGPHRSSHHSLTSVGRRFSPLGTGTDFKEVAPLEDSFSTSFLDQGIEQKPNLSIAAVNRPRSRSLRSAQSLLENSVDDDTPKDESGSDSERSDKKKALEDADNGGSAKKRSRTLTTPTQQRRLMQILEQRRQGMKKAQEQRAEQEASATTATDYGRARGYSFGAYPAPPDVYPQAQGHQQPALYGQGLPAYTSVALVPTHQGFDAFPSHMYGPRPTARDGMPRQLPQLHIQNNASNSSLSTLNESACSEFSWSEPSNNINNNWPEAQAGYPIPNATNATDRERMFPFEKRLNQPYESSHLQEFPSQGMFSTNPDFDQFVNLPHNTDAAPLSHAEAIQQSNLYHAQCFFHKTDEHATPTQRLVTLGGEGRPDRPNGLRNTANAYEETGRTLRDQVGPQRPAAWNDALSRLNITDYRGSQFLKAEKQSPQRQSICLGPSETNPNQEDAYPLEYSTVDYTESIIGRNCGEIPNGITPPDYVEFSSNPHLHLTEPHLLNEANDLDKFFHGTSPPDHHRKRSRSFNG